MSSNDNLSANAKLILSSSTVSPGSGASGCGIFGCGRGKKNTRNIIIGKVTNPGLSQEAYKAAIQELIDNGNLPKGSYFGGRRKTRRNKKTRKTRAQKKRSSK